MKFCHITQWEVQCVMGVGSGEWAAGNLLHVFARKQETHFVFASNFPKLLTLLHYDRAH